MDSWWKLYVDGLVDSPDVLHSGLCRLLHAQALSSKFIRCLSLREAGSIFKRVDLWSAAKSIPVRLAEQQQQSTIATSPSPSAKMAPPSGFKKPLLGFPRLFPSQTSRRPGERVKVQSRGTADAAAIRSDRRSAIKSHCPILNHDPVLASCQQGQRWGSEKDMTAQIYNKAQSSILKKTGT